MPKVIKLLWVFILLSNTAAGATAVPTYVQFYEWHDCDNDKLSFPGSLRLCKTELPNSHSFLPVFKLIEVERALLDRNNEMMD